MSADERVALVQEGRFAAGQVAILSILHAACDFYACFLAPLLPILRAELGLSYTACMSLSAIFTVTANLFQPVWGMMGAWMALRWMALGGPVLTVVAGSCLGVGRNYWVLAAILVAGGVGVGFYHPSGAALSAEFSGPRKSTGVSLFNAGGSVGVALSPVAIVGFVTLAGLRWMPVMALPGLVIVGLAWAYLQSSPGLADLSPSRVRGLSGDRLALLGMIFFLAFARAVAISGFFQFLPFFCIEREMSTRAAGSVLSLFLLASVFGVLAGGWMSDRWPPRLVMFISLALSAPLLVLSLNSEGVLFLCAVLLSGMLLYISVPVSVVLAQELLPGNASAASGVVIGLAWGAANLTMPAFGRLADMESIPVALWAISLTPLLAAASVVVLPSGEKVLATVER